MGGSPIKFRVVCFEPVCSEDNIVGAHIGDIEFGVFLVVVLVWCCDVYSLNSSGAYWARFVGGTVDILDGQGCFQGSEGELVFQGKGGIDNHSFGTAIEEGRGTDFTI